MIILLIYLAGCVAAFIAAIIISLDTNKEFTVGDLSLSFAVSVVSWVFILILVLCAMDKFIEKNKDKIIFKK